jgi:hypothetical protein
MSLPCYQSQKYVLRKAVASDCQGLVASGSYGTIKKRTGKE